MTDSEITVSILREIRDSIRTMDSNLSSRIDATNERIDKLDERLTGRIDSLESSMGARLTLVEHAVRDAGAQILMLTRYLKNKTEIDVEDLKVRVTRLESKVG